MKTGIQEFKVNRYMLIFCQVLVNLMMLITDLKSGEVGQMYNCMSASFTVV